MSQIGRFALLLVAGLLLGGAVEAHAQTAPLESDCFADNGRDLCDPREQRRVRQTFGAPSIGDLRKQHIQVLRAFFVDGYGLDMPLVSFERRSGNAPQLTVYLPGSTPPITAPVPVSVWDDLLRRSEGFDRPSPPRQPLAAAEDGSIVVSVCLHSWVATVEASEPSASSVRIRTQDACNEGFALPFAFEMADVARKLLPQCAAFSRDDYRTEVSLLQACGAQTQNPAQAPKTRRP